MIVLPTGHTFLRPHEARNIATYVETSGKFMEALTLQQDVLMQVNNSLAQALVSLPCACSDDGEFAECSRCAALRGVAAVLSELGVTDETLGDEQTFVPPEWEQ